MNYPVNPLFQDLHRQMEHLDNVRTMAAGSDIDVRSKLLALARDIELKISGLRDEARRLGFDRTDVELILSSISKHRTEQRLRDQVAEDEIDRDYPAFAKFRKAD
ncbi:MAG: hypothetical protein VX616_08460 [Actinomycetota bacterium]|nr:hypothetical protein [Actinomycetota bacterium]MED5346186.1 hypothetical protein [Actinomycetota bacterium]